MISNTTHHASRGPDFTSVAALCQAANALSQACLLLLSKSSSERVVLGTGEISPPGEISVGNLEAIKERVPARHKNKGMLGARMVSVYCAGTPGLENLARRIGRPLFKLGTTTSAVRTRLEELNVTSYGSLRQTPNGLVSEDGFDAWKSQRLAARHPPHPSVAVGFASIDVALPKGMTAQMFEAQLRARLEPYSLSHRPESNDCRRWTRRRNAWQTRIVEATEIYIFRPREDGKKLVACILDILASFEHCNENLHPLKDISLQDKPYVHRSI